MTKWFPPNLVYKEWRQQRVWIFLAALVTMCLPVLQLLDTLIQSAQADNWGVQSQLANLSLSIHQDLNLSSVRPLLTFVAIGLGVVPLCMDRGSGGLTYTLSGPVKKRELLRTKFFMGWVALTGVFTLFAVFSLTEALIFGLRGPSADAAAWYIFQMTVTSAIYAIAFATSTAVGNVLAAAVCAFGICCVPAVVYKLLETAIYYPVAFLRWHFFVYMSPASYTVNTNVLFGGPVIFFWYVIVIVVAYVVAQQLFDVSVAENYGNFFVFAVLWKWVVGLICAALALVTGAVFHANGRAFLPFFLMSLFVYWMVVSRAIRLYHRNRNDSQSV